MNRYEHDPLYDNDLTLTEHIRRAERHAQRALTMCYHIPGGRGLFFRLALGRAQSILMDLYKKELKNHQ